MAANEAGTVQTIPLELLLPWHNGGKGQPRQHFDPVALQELAASMSAGGFVGAIAVRPFPGRPGFYEILAGHRRTKAAALAHLSAIPAAIHDLDDRAARLFVLQDNLHREDFLPWEEGAGYSELVADGLSMAAVAARVGKSPSYVSGRIAIHLSAGARARELFLAKSLSLRALELATTLPDRNLSPVECPRCHVVNRDGAQVCAACTADLSQVFRCESGNPQAVFVNLCAKRGAVNGECAEIMERVKEAYGMAEAPVQASMGFDDQQVSAAALAVKSAFERKLDEVTKLQGFFLDNQGKLAELTPEQKRAVVAQCEVAQKLFAQIARATGLPEAQGDSEGLRLAV